MTDVDRGTTLRLATNGDGEYVASPLHIGRYTVTVEKEGFKKAVAGPVQVNIQDRVGVDMKLQPGAVTEDGRGYQPKAAARNRDFRPWPGGRQPAHQRAAIERPQLCATRTARRGRCRRRARITRRNHVRLQRQRRSVAAK